MLPEPVVENKKWLIRATGVAIALDKSDAGPLGDPKALAIIQCRTKNEDQDEADEKKKQKLIKEVMGLIQPLIDKIDKATDLTQTVKNDKGKQEQRQAKDKDLSQVMETTRGGTFSNSSGQEGSEAGQLALQAAALIGKCKQRLQGEKTDRWVVGKNLAVEKGSPVPLFTDDEIMSALHDPLLRTGDYTDSLVEDSMSRNQQMIDKTNASYQKELTDPANDPPVFGFKDLMSNGVDLASSIVGAVLESQGLASKTEVKDLLSASTEIAKLMLDVGDNVRGGKKSLSYDNIKKLIDELPAIAGDLVGALVSQDVGTAVTNAAKAALTIPDAFKAIHDKKPEDLLKAAGALLQDVTNSVVSAIEQKIATADQVKPTDSSTVTTEKQNKQTDDDNDLVLQGDLAGLAATFVSGTAVKLVAALRSGKPSSVSAVLFQFADDLTSAVDKVVIDKTTIANTLDQQKTPQDQDLTTQQNQNLSNLKQGLGSQEGVVQTVGSSVQGLVESREQANETLKSWGEKPEEVKTERQKKLEQVKQQLVKKVADDTYKELEEQGQNERKQLDDVLRGGKEATTENIGKMLADMQRDKALVSMLLAVAKGGLTVASKLLPAVGVISDAPKLYANLKKALDNYEYMTKFVEEHESALGSYSRFGPAIENFLNNQDFQFKRNSVAAAATGLSIIAGAIATALPVAAPAKTAIDIVGAGADMAFQAKQAKKLAKAWKETKKSFQNPKDRALAQKVRAMNPTLAKHVIAYGVTEENDPVARSMAEECGLTPAMLNDPSANLGAVKQFFEQKFPDDPSLKGYWDDGKSKWKKEVPTPEIARAALLKTYAALKKGFPGAATEMAVAPNLLGQFNFLASQKLDATDPAKMQPEARDKLKEALKERMTIAETLEAGLKDEGKRIAKAANDNAVLDVFDAFADAASDLGFAAFLRHTEVAKVK